MKLAVASVREGSSTAGLSPRDNLRTEVFLAGCKLGLRRHPCPDCFNSDLWDSQWFPQVEVGDLVNDIKKIGNPFVTIVGGEPLDQYEGLVGLLDKLWTEDVHTVVITHYTMEEIEAAEKPLVQWTLHFLKFFQKNTYKILSDNSAYK